MKIKAAVEKLSPEEREQFKDLIEECLQREQDIQSNYEQSNESLKKFVENIQRINLSVSSIKNSLETIKQEMLIAKTFLDNKDIDPTFNWGNNE